MKAETINKEHFGMSEAASWAARDFLCKVQSQGSRL